MISYLIIDDTDNANYFLFKYNLSNENKKRIKFLIDNYYLFSEKDYFSLEKILQRKAQIDPNLNPIAWEKFSLDLINLAEKSDIFPYVV